MKRLLLKTFHEKFFFLLACFNKNFITFHVPYKNTHNCHRNQILFWVVFHSLQSFFIFLFKAGNCSCPLKRRLWDVLTFSRLSLHRMLRIRQKKVLSDFSRKTLYTSTAKHFIRVFWRGELFLAVSNLIFISILLLSEICTHKKYFLFFSIDMMTN